MAVDPSSPSATLLAPLRDELGVVKTADAQAMQVANGRFHDLVAGKRLRIRGHEALDQAGREASKRRLAGAAAIDRYAGADPAPLIAAELACWALDIDGGSEPQIIF